MAGPLKYSSQRQSKPLRLSLCGGLALLVASASLYLVVALRYSNAVYLPFSWPASQETSDQAEIIQAQPVDSGDPFQLHPELHIARPPRRLKFDWNITRQQHRPDGVLRDVYFINGMEQ